MNIIINSINVIRRRNFYRISRWTRLLWAYFQRYYNIGVAFGPAGGQGVVGGTEVYAEVTYNSNDGFSAGYGVNVEAGVGVNLGPGVKDLSGGVYSTVYTSQDSRE